MFNRHNYYTANGNSNEILLNFFKNKLYNIISTIFCADDIIKYTLIKNITECDNLSDFCLEI